MSKIVYLIPVPIFLMLGAIGFLVGKINSEPGGVPQFVPWDYGFGGFLLLMAVVQTGLFIWSCLARPR